MALEKQMYSLRAKPRTEDIRGPYLRDQTAIIHSHPFRRLKHKTMVFFDPGNDHICTRIEHVLHVATIAATICKGLNIKGWNLDPDIAYAAGLGHDIGHAPFGHTGERALAEINRKISFQHENHSLRVVDVLANDYRGLNLTWAVRDAIICHNGERMEQYLSIDEREIVPEQKQNRKYYPATWEGCVVRFSDKFAYLGRDIEDALTAEFITIQDVPKKIRDALGENNGSIINTLVVDLIDHSDLSSGCIGLSNEKYDIFRELYEFNVKKIYKHPQILHYEDFCCAIIKRLYEYLDQCYEKYDPACIPDQQKYPVDHAFVRYLIASKPFYEKEKACKEQIITDYIAGMTDSYALNCMQRITIPQPLWFRGII